MKSMLCGLDTTTSYTVTRLYSVFMLQKEYLPTYHYKIITYQKISLVLGCCVKKKKRHLKLVI